MPKLTTRYAARMRQIISIFFNFALFILFEKNSCKIKISNGPSGNAVYKYLRQRKYGVRVATAARILFLPGSPGDLLKGRKHQAWRTNNKRAEAYGMRVRKVSVEEFIALADSASRSDAPPAHLYELIKEPVTSYMETWVGETADGDAIAFARYAVDAQCAVMKYFVATPSRDLSIIRWKLAAETFSDFTKRGIRYVISGSAINLSGGIDYYQDRLGFVRTKIEITA